MGVWLAKVSVTKKGILAIVLLAATVALLSVLARYLNDGFTILQQVYLRVFIALAVALAIFHSHLRWKVITKLPLREWGVIAFRGFFGYAVGVTLMSQAAVMTTISNVTFIAALPFVPLLGFIFLREKVTWWKLTFILGSLFGVVVLATNNPADLLSWQAGDLIAVVSTLGLALGYVSRKWHAPILNNQEITTLMFGFGILFVLAMSLVAGEGMPSFDLSWGLWIALVLAGALNVVKLFLANYGFEHISAVQAGNLLTLEGAWGILFGLIFYSEWPTWHGFLGGAIIVACVIGMNFYSHRGEAKMVAPPEGAHI